MVLTTECLREALGDHLGSVLTPELAATIEFLAYDKADRAVKPATFPRRAYRALTFQVESLRDILPELDVLHQRHFAETELHLQGVAMRPAYDYMAERERLGTLVQFTARDAEGNLAGNLRMYTGHSRHTGQLFAEEDTFYLLPEHRKGMGALVFLRYAEEMLVNLLGVKEIRISTKTVNSAGKLIEYRGFAHVANQYVKTF